MYVDVVVSAGSTYRQCCMVYAAGETVSVLGFTAELGRTHGVFD